MFTRMHTTHTEKNIYMVVNTHLLYLHVQSSPLRFHLLDLLPQLRVCCFLHFVRLLIPAVSRRNGLVDGGLHLVRQAFDRLACQVLLPLQL